MRRTSLAIGMVMLALVPAACTLSDNGDPIDEDVVVDGKGDAVLGVHDGSSAARGILAVVNRTNSLDLVDEAGLDYRAAKNIENHRDGADGLLGSSDDDRFQTLHEL